MELNRLNHYRLKLYRIHEDLVADLENEKEPSDVLRLVTAINEVRDIADDMRTGMLSDEQKKLIAAGWNNL